MERITLFANVLLPLPLADVYTYRVPFDMNAEVKEGCRVVVQFGRKKIYSGLIVKLHKTSPKGFEAKYILNILDKEPIVNSIQFAFWEWMAAYYMCSKGEVMNAALPSVFKLASESKIVLNSSFNSDYSNLNDKEYIVTEALELQQTLTLEEVSQIVEQKKVMPLVKTLIEKGVVNINEELEGKYSPKIKTFVRFVERYNKDKELQQLFNELSKRAFKQLEIVMKFIALSNSGDDDRVEIDRTILLKEANASANQLNALVKKEVFELYQQRIDRIGEYTKELQSMVVLNDYQFQAFEEIKLGFKVKDVMLLHGVTSSGKTEIYIRLIDECIKRGEQVLYLLPEIALSTQIISRLQKYFGNKVGVYHSKFNMNERAEIWYNVVNDSDCNDSCQVVLGARSALFLPFSNLGLIVVDEEHDYSYKQYDPSPRYNARDSAIYLASIHGAKTILGSATPSVETYYNARCGKYGLVEINKRYGGVQMPEVLVVDVKKESRQRNMKSHYSNFLLEHIREALGKKEQILLFQNRRGYSIRIECDMCNHIPECKNCDVTLTYHKHFNNLNCHYCGYSIQVPDKCPKCDSLDIQMKGFGTEKIQDELPMFFPDARIARMDLDTTRRKYAHQQLIHDFEERNIDILVGTQMITKGLDFDNVSIVGVLNADNMISFPDFRSFERSFQQIAQVSGRAGRKKKRGKVVVQTYNPYHSVIRYVVDNDYLAMYESQILERRNFKYPPFFRIIKLSLRHRQPAILNNAARDLSLILRTTFGKMVLGPEYPVVSRIKNYYIKDILVKLENKGSLNVQKRKIRTSIQSVITELANKQLRVVIDVDPY